VLKKWREFKVGQLKWFFELRNLSENDRLTALGLTTLEVGRKRLDLIQLFKIINEFEDVDIGIGMGNNMREGGGRRHGFQILISRERAGSYPMRGFSLPNRNATTWNILPSEVVNAGTLNFFRSKLDEHMRSVAWRRSIYS